MSVAEECLCPACGYQVGVPFFDGGEQPLVSIAWPQSITEAQESPKYPLSFLRCLDCGHIFNSEFEYVNVPYSDKPNLMYNLGKEWQVYINWVVSFILEGLPEDAVIVEIGCGNAELLQAIAEKKPQYRIVGFDLNLSCAANSQGVELRQELFVPHIHMKEYQPDLLIARHLLEHLKTPAAFVQLINYEASKFDKMTKLFAEVPCVDRAIKMLRLPDFFYEHHSQFTSHSFRRMFERSSKLIERYGIEYGGEVAFVLAQLGNKEPVRDHVSEAQVFCECSSESKTRIQKALDTLAQSNKTVAFWGGTGKSAAFMNLFEVDTKRFPYVVDSDESKVGSFVSGTGQEIQFRDLLHTNPVDVIIITTQWRAKDIVAEIKSVGIQYESILLEHQGELVNYHTGNHPYS